MWKEGKKILFTCTVIETGKDCLTGGWVELSKEISDVNNNDGNGNRVEAVASDSVFKELANKLDSQPNLASKVGASFLWNITRDGVTISQWGRYWIAEILYTLWQFLIICYFSWNFGKVLIILNIFKFENLFSTSKTHGHARLLIAQSRVEKIKAANGQKLECYKDQIYARTKVKWKWTANEREVKVGYKISATSIYFSIFSNGLEEKSRIHSETFQRHWCFIRLHLDSVRPRHDWYGEKNAYY